MFRFAGIEDVDDAGALIKHSNLVWAMLIYGCVEDGCFKFGFKKHCEISRMPQVEQPYCTIVATSNKSIRVSTPILYRVNTAFVVCLYLTYDSLLFDIVDTHDTVAASCD